MKIAFIVSSNANAGPIVFTKYLAEGLLETGCEVVIFYIKESADPLKFSCPTKKICFYDKVDFSSFDIVHSTGALPDIFVAVRTKLRAKWVTSAHNLYKVDLVLLHGKFKGFALAYIWKFALLRVKNFIVSSDAMMDYYCAELGEKNYKLIPYGIKKTDVNLENSADLNLLTTIRNNYKIVGSVGVLTKRKGFHQLIEFLKMQPSYAVVLIGDGEENDHLIQLAKKLGVSERLFLLGFKNNSVGYYRYFDVYATTSYSEGFGLAMLEAMSQSLPIVCTDLPIYKQYFDPSKICLYKPDDVDGLCNAILKISNNKEQYSKAAFDLYSEFFSIESMALRHRSFYKDAFESS
jgi:glycosyltransferase involved in cell wall biosynthesis